MTAVEGFSGSAVVNSNLKVVGIIRGEERIN